jgi:hypothetical protein
MTINTIFPVHIWEEIFLYIDPLEQRRTLQDLPSFVRCLLEVQGSTAFHRCLEHHIYALPIAIKESLMPSTQMSQAESPAVTASIARRTLRQFTEPQLRRLVCWSVDSGYRQTIRLLLANGMDPELLRYPLQRAHTYNDISTKQWIEAMIMNDARPRRSVPELIDTSRLIRKEIECQFNHVNPRNCDLMIRQAIKFGVDLYLLPPSYTLIHPSNIQHVSEMKRLLFEYGLNITMTGLGRNGCCKHNSGYVNKMFLLM